MSLYQTGRIADLELELFVAGKMIAQIGRKVEVAENETLAVEYLVVEVEKRIVVTEMEIVETVETDQKSGR